MMMMMIMMVVMGDGDESIKKDLKMGQSNRHVYE
jgi:hypothetical protein